MFLVGKYEYDIVSACLEVFDRSDEDTVCWGIKIVGRSRGGSGDGAWKPAILSDVLLETSPGQMSHWYEIAGTTIAWDEPNEDPQALFEVYETSAIYRCKWQFIAMGNGGVRLLFDGMADVDVDHRRVSIHVETPLGVAPWPMGRLAEQECRNRLHHLGFRDPVEFRIIGNDVSSLVFLDQ